MVSHDVCSLRDGMRPNDINSTGGRDQAAAAKACCIVRN
jgi:hypothetical protein